MQRNRISIFFSTLPLLSLAVFGLLQVVPDGVLSDLLAIFSRDRNIENVPRVRSLLSKIVLFLSATFAWLWVALFSKSATHNLPENTCRPNVAAVSSFVVATASISGYLLHRTGFSMPLIYRKEGFLEIMSALFFIIAAVQFARIFLSTVRDRLDPTYPQLPAYFLLAAVTCFFIGMEEISWGQHYLGFNTPEWVESRNYQSELTLHNFLPQDTLNFVTVLFFWILFASVAILVYAKRLLSGPFWDRVRPDTNLLGLSLLMAVTASMLHADPAEFLLSLAAVYYAFASRRRLDGLNSGASVLI